MSPKTEISFPYWAMDAYGKVTIIVRRSTGISNDKLTEVIHHDFNDYASIASFFENQDVAYYCIGVYNGAVNRDTFRMITVD
jgi:glutamate-1-semialdehyde aminotransferase